MHTIIHREHLTEPTISITTENLHSIPYIYKHTILQTEKNILNVINNAPEQQSN